MKLITLNHTALRILAAMQAAADAGGMPLTVRDLMRAVGSKSPHGIAWHLKKLKRLGLVTWQQGECRTLSLTCRLEPVEDEPT